MKHFQIELLKSRARGFSLLEVLVTIVLVAIGLLGVAGLQVSALKLGFVAQTRSSGSITTNDILDRIRSNVADIESYNTAYGVAAGGSSQAARDVLAWKTELIGKLPGGDGKIVVKASTDVECDASALAKCWEVEVAIRWTEGNVRGGSSTPTSFFKTSTRI